MVSPRCRAMRPATRATSGASSRRASFTRADSSSASRIRWRASSCGTLLSRRRRVQPYMPSVLATVIVFLAHVQFWWGSFEFGQRIESNFFAFLVFLLSPILLYLIAVLVLPEL